MIRYYLYGGDRNMIVDITSLDVGVCEADIDNVLVGQMFNTKQGLINALREAIDKLERNK